jgi:hypothetical protein
MGKFKQWYSKKEEKRSAWDQKHSVTEMKDAFDGLISRLNTLVGCEGPWEWVSESLPAA